MASDFTHREVPALRKRLFRLGLSGTFGLDEAGCREALERVQYVFWSPRMKGLDPALRAALARDRERYAVAAGPFLAYFPGAVRKAAESALRTLGTDYLDVFQLYWLGKMSAFTGAVQEELVALREEGKVRALGASTHDRPRAGRLAEDSILDLLMIRYNAAHPGAETDVFPHLSRRHPAVVAYTATSWRKLLRPPRGWKGPPATAGDCYRFCLTSPYVDVVLTGHDHIYERFALQNASGAADPNGIREFVVGTGGANHTNIVSVAKNSEVRDETTFGVLKMTLHLTSYGFFGMITAHALLAGTAVGIGRHLLQAALATCQGGLDRPDELRRDVDGDPLAGTDINEKGNHPLPSLTTFFVHHGPGLRQTKTARQDQHHRSGHV